MHIVIPSPFPLSTVNLPEDWIYHEDEPSPTTLPSYESWLPRWMAHIADSPERIWIPPSACQLHTPLVPANWEKYLAGHPNRSLVQFFLSGITEGFRIGCNHAGTGTLKAAKKNLTGALDHPEVIQEYLSNEMTLRRVAGPFKKSQLPTVQISRFGVIPKSHQRDKWRLITDLSYPKHCSINDGIPKSLCGLSYVTIDDAINKIMELGPGTLLAKLDVKSAFRLIPVHPADRHLLAMQWKDDIMPPIWITLGTEIV